MPNPSAYRRISSHDGKFSADLCFFWHGIFDGKKQPVDFYTRASRAALERAVEDAIYSYLMQEDAARAGHLTRLWELVQTYIIAQNEAIESGSPCSPVLKIRLPDDTLIKFLHLLYGGKSADAFWRAFSRKHRLRPVGSPSRFWDHFDEFQASRLDVGGWLAENARGKILDLGAGSHSYLMVDTAADISKAALAHNPMAAKRKVIPLLDELSVLNWPFAKNSFDTVMLNSILSYVKNRTRLFSLIRRTLRADGVLLITNAPVLPHHPASFFIESEADAATLMRELKTAGFDAENDSRGDIVLIRTRPCSTARHMRAR